MRFSELVDQAGEFLQRRERVSYRALKREFDLDDETLEDLKAELIEVKELAVDKDGKMLVWVGDSPVSSSKFQVPSSNQSLTPNPQPPAAERRQLTRRTGHPGVCRSSNHVKSRTGVSNLRSARNRTARLGSC